MTSHSDSELVCSGIGYNITAFACSNKALRVENQKLIEQKDKLLRRAQIDQALIAEKEAELEQLKNGNE